MTKPLALLVLLALATPAAAQVTGTITPATPSLKRNVVVTDEIVRIGDLVENAGAVAGIAVFRAPDLGTTGTVPAARVLDAVRPHHLAGLGAAGISSIMVTRVSRSITAKDFEARITQALAGHQGLGDAENLGVMFNHEVRTLHVEANLRGELEVVRSSYDPRSGRFDVTLDLPGSAVTGRGLRFIGTIAETVETAVVTRAVARGDILSDADVVMERRPKAETAGEVVALSAAVGRTLRRPLKPGQVLKSADLARTQLVSRNEAVTIVFHAPGMVLTMQGKALDSGGEGDLIGVLNMQSKRTVQGTITGQNQVTVTSRIPRLAASTVLPHSSVSSNATVSRAQ